MLEYQRIKIRDCSKNIYSCYAVSKEDSVVKIMTALMKIKLSSCACSWDRAVSSNSISLITDKLESFLFQAININKYGIYFSTITLLKKLVNNISLSWVNQSYTNLRRWIS